MACAIGKSPSKLTISEAKQLDHIVEREALRPGDKWYLISIAWWSKFIEQKDAGEKTHVELPPINNDPLIKKTETGFQLKPKLVEGLDFVPVPEKVFEKLKAAFGVENEERDVIERSVVEGTLMEKHTFVEIYPFEIKIALFARPEEIINLKVSQAETVDSIRTKALKALNISDSDHATVRFLVKESVNFELLPNSINKVALTSLLTSGSVIYVDDGDPNLLQKIQEINNGNRRLDMQSNTRPLAKRGHCGLQNLGNTCFMNSALQCLSNVPEFTNYFLTDAYRDEINTTNALGTKGALARAYGVLIHEMWSGNMTCVKPNKLKSVIGEFAPRFNGYSQQDSQELTSFLLDGLHEDLNRIKKKPYVEENVNDSLPDEEKAAQAWDDYKKRNDSIVVDLMHGQLKSTVVCPVCEKISVKFDPFCFLSVPVPAKERTVVSNITVVRSNTKWAKFVITHTNKATVGQALANVKHHLNLPPSQRIVLLSTYTCEILNKNAVFAPTTYYSGCPMKSYFAYIVDSGPLVVVENKMLSTYDRNIGVPLVLNHPDPSGKTFSYDMLMEQILPSVRLFLWKEREDPIPRQAAATEKNGNVDCDQVADENAPPPANTLLPTVASGKEENGENDLPCEALLIYGDQKATIPLTKKEGDEAKVTLEDYKGNLKLTLKWRSPKNFEQIDLSRLVDREINMSTALKKCYTLDECIDMYTSQEQLDQNDSWYCPNCKKHQRAFKKLDVWSLPRILIIHLKRFQYSRYNRDKIDTEIVIPTRNFDLSKKLVGKNSKTPQKYDLIAISNHIGGLGSGHYTAQALNGEQWVEFNDSLVSVSKGTMAETLSSREAYILYYRRQQADPLPTGTAQQQQQGGVEVTACSGSGLTNERNGTKQLSTPPSPNGGPSDNSATTVSTAKRRSNLNNDGGGSSVESMEID